MRFLTVFGAVLSLSTLLAGSVAAEACAFETETAVPSLASDETLLLATEATAPAVYADAEWSVENPLLRMSCYICPFWGKLIAL